MLLDRLMEIGNGHGVYRGLPARWSALCFLVFRRDEQSLDGKSL